MTGLSQTQPLGVIDNLICFPETSMEVAFADYGARSGHL